MAEPVLSAHRNARAARRALALLFLSLGYLSWVHAPLEAANGDVLSVSNALLGKDLTGIAFDSAGPPVGGAFWAVGRLTGKVHHLAKDLTTILGEINNPHGVGAFPNIILTWGIAFRSTSKTLFVLAQDGRTWKVKEIKTDGTEVPAGAFTITPPDGDSAGLRGLAFDSLTRGFWYLDGNNDRVVLADLTGATVQSWKLPGDEPPETTIPGEGISFELDDVSQEPRIWVTYGDIFRKNPSRLMQLKATGEPTGIEVPLTQVTQPGLGGFQLFRVGQQKRVAIVTTEGKILQVEHVVPDPIPPNFLSCALTRTNKVALSWVNNGKVGPDKAYGGQITILRNGVAFTNVPGSTVSFIDSTPLEGTSSYSLRAANTPAGPLSPPSIACTATVGTGGIIQWIPFTGISLYDIASDPSTGTIYVTDDIGGRIYKFDEDLHAIGEVPSPWDRPGPIAFLPLITIQDIEIRDVLAVGRTDGPLVRIMDEDGVERTTISLEGKPTGLTYIPQTQEFAFLDADTHAIAIRDRTGRGDEECTPSPLLNLPEMEIGVTYDPIQGTFLSKFGPHETGQPGGVMELYNGPNCLATGFEIGLESLGEGFDEPGFVSGISINGNTLLVGGRQSNALFQVLIFPFGPAFIRGDFDRNSSVNITDAVSEAGYLFRSGTAPACPDAADANDDGILDLSDPVYLLFHLFRQGPPPPAPYPASGTDPTFRDNLGCGEDS